MICARFAESINWLEAERCAPKPGGILKGIGDWEGSDRYID